MRWSTAAGVGVVVVLALAILVGAYVLLAGAGVIGNTYPVKVDFDNAQGITKGADVLMSGVKIGVVDQVELTPGNKALVTLKVRKDTPIPPGARLQIATTGLFTPPVVDVIPLHKGSSTTAALHGTSAPTLDQLMPQAQRLIANLTDLSNSLKQVVGDRQLVKNLKRSTANLAEVSERGKAIAANLEAASVSGKEVAASFRQTSAHLNRTVLLVQQTLGENRSKLGQVLTSVSDTMGAMQGLVEQLQSVVADPKMKHSLSGTVANLEQATANLAKLSSNMERLSADQKLNEDLRATVTATRGTMEETQRLVSRLNRILGSSRKSTEGAREQVRNTDVTVDFAQQANPGRARLDLNAFIPGGDGRFYRVGIADVTEGNRLNLQLGRSLGGNSLRYGLYASRLGVGLDIGPPSHPRLSADLYSLADPRLDLRSHFGLRPGLDLTLGVHRLFDRNSPTVGVTWRK